jgi:hypothetical protein
MKKETFLKYLKAERDAFVIAINSQKWNTEMRTEAENLIIAYDQAVARLEEQQPASITPLIQRVEESKASLSRSDEFQLGYERCKSDVLEIIRSVPVETKAYEIDLDGNVKAKISITNNIPTVLAAMNGWGNPIDIDKINIEIILP